MKIKSSSSILRLALILLVSSFPAKIRDFHFKKLPFSRALVVTIKRSSPPMALVEDMRMSVGEEAKGPLQRLEPVVSEAGKGSRVRVLAGIRIAKRDIAPKAPENYARAVEKNIEVNERPPVISDSDSEPESDLDQRLISHAAKAGIALPAPSRIATTDPKTSDSSQQPRSWVTRVLRNPSQTPQKPETPASSPAQAALPEAPDTRVTITGHLDVTGVGFTGVDSLVVFREMNGKKIEEGSVNAERGEFSIRSSEARGYLVAQLFDVNGEEKGKGEVWLNRYGNSTQSLSGIKLEITPTTNAFAGSTSSAYSTDSSEDPIFGAKIKYASSLRVVGTNKVGRFEIKGIHPKSSVILTAEKKGYWNSLVLTNVRGRAAVTMYPESMVAALHQIVARDFGLKVSDIKNGGVVWGRVLKGRTPIEGAKVEAADSQGIGPIYFNALHLPDTKLEATTSNGLFVFLNVPAGTQSMRAQVGGKYLPAKIFPVDEHHVTPIEITTASKTLGVVQSYDAFTKEAVASSVRFAASPKMVRTNTEGLVRLSVAKSEEPLFIEAEASGEYLPIRMSFDRGEKVYPIPQVREVWLSGLQINRAPGTGMVVGFIEGKRFDVFLDVNGKPHNDILYFDPSGNITPMPVAGGGFIIANVPNGMRTVSLVPEGSEEIFHQVVSVDDEYMSVVSQRF